MSRFNSESFLSWASAECMSASALHPPPFASSLCKSLENSASRSIDSLGPTPQPTSVPTLSSKPIASSLPSLPSPVQTTTPRASAQTATLNLASSSFVASPSLVSISVTTGTETLPNNVQDINTTSDTTSSPSGIEKNVGGGSRSSFLQNKAAVGYTFALIAILIFSGFVGTCLLLRKRRRQRRLAKGISNLNFKREMYLSGTTMADSLQDVYARQGKEFDTLHE